MLTVFNCRFISGKNEEAEKVKVTLFNYWKENENEIYFAFFLANVTSKENEIYAFCYFNVSA